MGVEYDYLFKILIVGDSGVGKSSIMKQFTEQTFSEGYISTIGVDFKIKSIDVDEKMIKLQIWDTAGQERFRAITKSYYRGSQGILIVYDVGDYESFKNVSRTWMKEIKNAAVKKLNTILVANKCDLKGQSRIVSSEEGMNFAASYEMLYIETSAKNGENIDETFYKIAQNIKADMDVGETTTLRCDIVRSHPAKPRGCC